MSTAVAVKEEANELSCVLIPTPGLQLLLPNVCIAEIVPWRRAKPIQDGPPWCMGYVGWRGQNVPVVWFPCFDDATQRVPGSASCLVVMNRSRNPAGPAFYAMAAVGLPRMLQLGEEDLHNLDVEIGVADVMQVRVGTEVATIPNLAYIEEQLSELA